MISSIKENFPNIRLIFLLPSLIALNLNANNIQIRHFTFEVGANWPEIVVLPSESVLLRDENDQLELSTFNRSFLFENHKEYTFKEFAECLAGIQCAEAELKLRIDALPLKEKRIQSSTKDVCSDETITCYIYSPLVDDYTFAAFIYSNKNETYYLQAQTTLHKESAFIKQLNTFKLN